MIPVGMGMLRTLEVFGIIDGGFGDERRVLTPEGFGNDFVVGIFQAVFGDLMGYLWRSVMRDATP